MVPADGIYAGKAILDGETYSAAIHVGPNVTFGESDRGFEVHLLDFAGRIYGEWLEVDFIARIRDSVRFETAERLQAAIADDCRRVREVVGKSESTAHNTAKVAPLRTDKTD